MFWQTPFLLLGALGALCNAAPAAPLEGDVDALGVPGNFTMDDALDTRSLEERFTVTYVFRADKRSPAEIDAAGGFLPKGWTSKSKFEDISLYRHVKGAANGFSMDNDGYVSTTSSQSVAEGWVVKFLGGSGYTYKIATYANLIDVQDTLKKYNIYPEEKEFAALKIIPFDQIMGWASFSKTPKYGVVKGTPVANKKFNRAKYENKAHGGAQYSLAGFPNNHPAWKEDPWWFFTHCRPATRDVDIFARESSIYEREIEAAQNNPEVVEDDTDLDTVEHETKLVARARVRTSRPSTRKKPSAGRKSKSKTSTEKKPATTKKPTGTTKPKCTAAMKKAGKCKSTTTCSAADKKANKCDETCSAKDKKANKCCTAMDKKNNKCNLCGPSKTPGQFAREYWNQIQMGKAPKSGAHPKGPGKKGGKGGTKSG